MNHRYFRVIDSPIASLLLRSSGDALTGLWMGSYDPTLVEGLRRDDTLFDEAHAQLDAYFAGQIDRFDLVLSPEGTVFQQKVWIALAQIPCGETRSYGQIATQVGSPDASRAVGMANHRNPIGIVIPCHRVIGASGTLTGYAGGLDRKRWLLDHERRIKGASTQLSLLG